MAFFSRTRPVQPSTAAGQRVYAVGDVHGRYDLLRRLLTKIVAHWEIGAKTFKSIELLFLGDIIDRGPQSAECLRLVEMLTMRSQARLLRGNHEDLLLHTIAGNAVAQRVWLENGGDAALASFGAAPPEPGEDAFDFAERVRAAIPPEQIEMLEAAPIQFVSGDYFFVHAGVRPGVALARQDERDLLFIRDEFTASNEWHGAMVVHGHTIVEEVDIRANRIAIDTGAYRSDRLSCLVLDGRRRDVITT